MATTASMAVPSTPPQRYHRMSHSCISQLAKENCAPEWNARPALTVLETPLKAVAGPDDVLRKVAVESAGQVVKPEVKNTFIHFGSPLRTVSVMSPPKTVPSYFAPEVANADRLHTPASTPLVMHARTPCSAGGPTNGIFANAAPPLPMHAAPPVPTLPTRLRLSDFLPSPATGHAVSQAAAGPLCQLSLAGASLQPFDAGTALQMPQVPMLPGGQVHLLPACVDAPCQHFGSHGLPFAQFPMHSENGTAMFSSSCSMQQGFDFNGSQLPCFTGEPAPVIAGRTHFVPPPPPSGPPMFTFQGGQTEAHLMQPQPHVAAYPQSMCADQLVAMDHSMNAFVPQHSLGNDRAPFAAPMVQYSEYGAPNALAFGTYIGTPLA